MNCANHSDQAAVAFCRTCGKPLCNQCTRDVRGVIYCEACLAARMEGTQPAPGYIPPQPPYTPVPPTPPPQTGYQQFMDQGLGLKVGPGPVSGPNPTVAGILAGFFPFGVGAVYCSQYAKGLAHLLVMVLLIVGESSDVPAFVHVVLAFGIAFFYVYQIIDAVRSARAIQLGEPAPDPFGFGQMFSTGEKIEGSTKVPAGAAVLIGLGILFLLHTVGLFEIGAGVFLSLILLFFGAWLFARQWGLLGPRTAACYCENCRTRRLMGPAIVVTLGIIFLLHSTSRFGFWETWPAILLVIGVVKLMQSNASYTGHIGPLPPGTTGYPSTPPPPVGGSQAIFPGTAQNPPAPPAQGIDGEVKNV
jgi:hypothetical protein